MTGTQIVHIPYKGGAAGIADLIAGQVQLMLEGMNSITPHAKAGRVRSLGQRRQTLGREGRLKYVPPGALFSSARKRSDVPSSYSFETRRWALISR